MRSALLQQLNYGAQKAAPGGAQKEEAAHVERTALQIAIDLAGADLACLAGLVDAGIVNSSSAALVYDPENESGSSALAQLLSVVPRYSNGLEFVKWVDASTGEDLLESSILSKDSVLSAVTREPVKTWSGAVLPEEVSKAGLTTWTYSGAMQKVVPGGNPGHFVCVYTGSAGGEDYKLVDFQYEDQSGYTFATSPYVVEVGEVALTGTTITSMTNLTQSATAANLNTSNMLTRGVAWADNGSKLVVNYSYTRQLLTYNAAKPYVLSSLDTSNCTLVALGASDIDARDQTVCMQFSSDGKKFFKSYNRYQTYAWYKLNCTSVSAYSLAEPWELSSADPQPVVYDMGSGGSGIQICDKPLFAVSMSLDGKSLIGCYRSNAAGKAKVATVLKLVKIDFEEGWDLSKPVKQQECTVVDDVSYEMPLYADVSPDGSHIVYAYGASKIVFVSVPIA